MGPQKKTNSRVSIFPYIAVSTDAHLMNLHLPSETKTDHQLNLTIFIQSQTIRVGNSSKIPSESFRASKKKKNIFALADSFGRHSSQLQATLRPSVSYQKKQGSPVSGSRVGTHSRPEKRSDWEVSPLRSHGWLLGPLQWHVECSEESPQKIKGLKSRGGRHGGGH